MTILTISYSLVKNNHSPCPINLAKSIHNVFFVFLLFSSVFEVPYRFLDCISNCHPRWTCETSPDHRPWRVSGCQENHQDDMNQFVGSGISQKKRKKTFICHYVWGIHPNCRDFLKGFLHRSLKIVIILVVFLASWKGTGSFWKKYTLFHSFVKACLRVRLWGRMTTVFQCISNKSLISGKDILTWIEKDHGNLDFQSAELDTGLWFLDILMDKCALDGVFVT